MAGVFETATRAAIEEIIQSHAKESKFGWVLTPDGFRTLTDDLYELLATSRSLKAAGDRILGGTANASRATLPPRNGGGRR